MTDSNRSPSKESPPTPPHADGDPAAPEIPRCCSTPEPPPPVPLHWSAIDDDDFILKDADGRVYAHMEQMDDDYWWASVSVMEEHEPANFAGPDAYQKARLFCEGMTQIWFRIRDLAKLPVHNPGGYEVAAE